VIPREKGCMNKSEDRILKEFVLEDSLVSCLVPGGTGRDRIKIYL